MTAWYLLGVLLFWMLGIEGIYQHPFPFYAFISPVFTSLSAPALSIALVLLVCGLAAKLLTKPSLVFYIAAGIAAFIGGVTFVNESLGEGSVAGALQGLTAFPWFLLSLLIFSVSLIGYTWTMSSLDWFGAGPGPRETRWMLIGLVVFAFVFPASVAMLRDGPQAISQAYERHTYEYINDVGLGGSIRGLFQDYVSMHPYLSMHAQVHPPGPIAILWILSYVAGREPMGLSLASMALGALSVFPMYLWARELFERRTAITCTALYTLVPSIVLFTATSADITFMPFTLTTLFLFQRAINRSSLPYALAAGICYGLLAIISFSIISIGVYFGFAGLIRLTKPEARRGVIQTAVLMAAGLLLLLGAVWWWSGFDIIEVFQLSKEQFDTDQRLLDIHDPRLPLWTWKFGNPACWFFFAGIPISVLFVWRLYRADHAHRAFFYVFALTLVAFDILYLARGEGERSAMYVMPFLVIPAGHLLDEFGAATRSPVPFVVTAAFLGIQSWAIESILYTYW
ncbi:MAG: glycosyltransferase family 39 protein [Candidatus Hydrogenedentes bacterium]|nr:glycosyltransferase family 39 protein [Candidatus Hydrogenedentota bacterium]